MSMLAIIYLVGFVITIIFNLRIIQDGMMTWTESLLASVFWPVSWTFIIILYAALRGED